MKIRRALTHVGAQNVETDGDAESAAKLAHALDVPPASQEAGKEGPDRAHVHGFHAYPARLHPTTAARLIDLAGAPHVLDPFCGSGTVLVESMIAGLAATGIDLNPLAVRLSECKTRARTDEEIAEIPTAAQRIRAHADERRTKRAGATHRYGAADVRLFDPHVLLELDGLASRIALEKGHLRRDLEIVLSAILVKVSRRASDTREHETPRRIAAGYTAKLFFRKAEELARRLREFHALVSNDARARVIEGDSLEMRETAAAIVTSPPYAATYDYLEHHEARMRWLRLDSNALARGEMGARRRYATLDPRAAREEFQSELARFFSAAVRALPSRGKIAIVIADSGVRGGALRADEIARAAARQSGAIFVARASQRRPHFHARGQAAFRREPRAEHAILFETR